MRKDRADGTTDQLWAKAQAGDGTAWMRLQRDWYLPLTGKEKRIFRQLPGDDVENIAAEVLEDLYLRIQDFPTWGHAWRYASRDCHYRALHAASHLPPSISIGPEPIDPRSIRFLSNLEYEDAVESMLRKYPDERKRDALRMVFVDGYTRTETSSTKHVGKSELQRWVIEFKEKAKSVFRE